MLIWFLISFFVSSVRLELPSCFTINVAYDLGHSIASKSTTGPFDCQEWCQMVRRCSHFAFNYGTGTCFLRQGDRQEAKTGYVSGPKYCPSVGVENKAKPICKGNLCIEGGAEPHEGNVIVDGKPVCDDNWGLEDAAVVCRQLGFPGVVSATVESAFGTVSAEYSMDKVRCYGNETTLSDCYHKKLDACYGNEGAGVVCATKSVGLLPNCFKEDEICLAGGNSPGSGNVYIGGYPVCHNGWDFPDANVVCRSLGYIGATDFTIKSFFGLSDNYFKLSNVDCRGDEHNLSECPKYHSVGDCDANTVAGVYCTPFVGSLGLGNQNEGAVIGLSIAVALLLFILCSIVFYIQRGRGELKIKSLRLPTNMMNNRTGTVENLVGQDFNQIYSSASNA
eukprot:GFUD01118748.1.p1 GENE.GFUD01118748.1~~GFUD01118748.1.p1  ORF type:complete len:392 (+),score=56.20 GFUD01118748.1:17-1192(+)